MGEILTATFRANPSYELVAYGALPVGQRELLHDLCRDPEFYGILRPRLGCGLGVKSVCRNTARLLAELGAAGPLPEALQRLCADVRERLVTRLLWDGVLQVEIDGEFRCGAAAGQHFHCPEASPGEGVIARLSADALHYGQYLGEDDLIRLSARLYFYNRRPVTPWLTCQFSTPERIASHLGFGPGGRVERMIATAWSQLPRSPGKAGWAVWDRAGRRTRWNPAGTYKLYVSPAFESVGEVFPRVVAVFTDLGVPRFKVGRTLPELLRPDKIVAYLPDADVAGRVAGALANELRGTPAHGTPFTAALTTDGLLSWGVDPPSDRQPLGWQERESWRLWLTNRLAAALLAARATAGAAIEPWRAAMQRIRLEGVDPATWAPPEWPAPGTTGAST